FLMLASWAAADLTWWRWADVRLRGLPGASAWRAALATFVAAQLSFLLVYAAGHSPDIGLLAWPIGVYLWHFLLLPLMIAALLTAKAYTLDQRGRRSIARHRPRAPHVGRARPANISSRRAVPAPHMPS